MTKLIRVFELAPGDHFIKFTIEYVVTLCENGFIYYKPITAHTGPRLHSFGWKSREIIELIPNNKNKTHGKERKTDTNTTAV